MATSDDNSARADLNSQMLKSLNDLYATNNPDFPTMLNRFLADNAVTATSPAGLVPPATATVQTDSTMKWNLLTRMCQGKTS